MKTSLRVGRLASAVGVHSILGIAAALFAAPFVWLACSAFKRNEDFFTSPFLPTGNGFLGVAWEKLTTDHFVRLLSGLGMYRAVAWSVFYSSVTALVATLVCAMAGFALARLNFRGRTWLTTIVLGGVIIPSPLLLAPGYQLLFRLGLLDSYAGLILPAVAPAFGIFLFRQAALTSVPVQVLEAARIDGCGDVRTFFLVALPLLRPMVGTFLLITFVGTWNNFISPQVVLQSPDKFPLSVAVAQLRGVYYQDYGLLMAGTLISVLPVATLFIALQNEFVSGLTAGAVKG